jgi:hypothetical protein
MINIEIKGSCVTREAFNFIKDLNNSRDIKFNIINYIFQKPICVLGSNPISVVDNKTIENIQANLINSESVRDFVVRQVAYSFSKDFLKKDKGDALDSYFIMDFIDERMKTVKVDNSYVEYRNEIYNELTKYDHEIVLNSFDLFVEYFDKFMEKVLENYNLDKIILNKAYAVYKTNCNGKILPHSVTFENYNDKKIQASYSVKKASERNELLSKIYNYIEQKYPAIKIIELPIEEYYSEIDHTYGRGFYHYNKQYYIDFLERLLKIIDNTENKHEGEINSLRNKYYIKGIKEKVQMAEALLKRADKDITRELNLDEIVLDTKNAYNNIQINLDKKVALKSSISNENLINYTFYNENQKPNAVLQLNDAQMINKVNMYNENGKVHTQVLFKENKVYKVSKFSSTGKRVQDVIIGEFLNIGVPQIKINYDSEGNRSQYIRHYGTGKVASKTLYNKDGSYNKTVYYDEEGNIERERIYYPSKIKKQDFVFKNGVVNQIEKFFSTGTKKEIQKLDSNGNVILTLSRSNQKESFTEKK